MAAVEFADSIGGLTLQRRLHLLGDDTTAEDASERVTDGTLQATFEAGNDAHLGLLGCAFIGHLFRIRDTPMGVSTVGHGHCMISTIVHTCNSR